jgi:hypothetical protein
VVVAALAVHFQFNILLLLEEDLVVAPFSPLVVEVPVVI